MKAKTRNELTAVGIVIAAFALAPAQAIVGDAVLEQYLEQLERPPGFHFGVFARVPGARSLAYAPEIGTVFVGSWGDSVHAVMDKNKDGKAETAFPILTGLKVPNGVAWHKGHLYVGEQHRIGRYEVSDVTPGEILEAQPEVLYDKLTDDFHHGWRYIGFGPGDKLYVAVGAPCNVCDTKGDEGTIIRMNPDGSEAEVFAKGVRNSVGFDFHPKTDVLHFTDNGADMMGDNRPPCELNAAPVVGLHFGFPYYGGGTERPEGWADKKPPQPVTMPVVEFQAHTAPLGLRFNRGEMFPPEYRHDAFVAQHGSWNRTAPVGYQIKRIIFDDQGNAVGEETFAQGWRQGNTAWGRPTDILQLPDGSLLVSDDYQGVIYRITYDEQAAAGEVGTNDAKQTNSLGESAPEGSATRGKFLGATCSGCHGIDGNSRFAPTPSIAGQHANYMAQELKAFQSGTRQTELSGLMINPVRGLSEQELHDLAAFFAAKPAKVIAERLNPELVKRGLQVYRDACMSCHGPEREGNAGAGIPALYAQHADYTAIQLNAYAQGKRRSSGSAVMREAAKRLSDEQIEAVSAYLQTVP
jgi:glucose/arabinose dehydrogenase/cytochrome c553